MSATDTEPVPVAVGLEWRSRAHFNEAIMNDDFPELKSSLGCLLACAVLGASTGVALGTFYVAAKVIVTVVESVF